jgi:uracil-DNA glycosylase
MGFCYPGKAVSGDNPPRAECAPRWHEKLNAHLPNIALTLLIGRYAQASYLGSRRKATLGETGMDGVFAAGLSAAGPPLAAQPAMACKKPVVRRRAVRELRSVVQTLKV